MYKETTIHTGKVVAMKKSSYTIVIDKVEKCDGCAVSTICRDGNDHITVDKSCAKSPLSVGDFVKIEISPGMTWRAILYSSLLPLLVLVLIIIAVMLIWGNETVASIAAIAGVLAYYAIIYRIRLFSQGRFKYNFKIYRLTN